MALKQIISRKSQMDKIRKHFQETGGSSSDIDWFNVKAPDRGNETKAQFRVLPPWGKSADGFFYYTVGQHFGFSVGGRTRAISCRESVDNENKGKCPVCIFISRLRNTGQKDHDKLQQRLRANRRYFVNIIDREDEDKIKIFGTNKKCIETILDASDDPDVGDITDPKTGRDIVVIRKGSGMFTRYTYRIRQKPTPVTFDWKDLYELDKVVDTWMDYNTMCQIITDNFAEELREVGLKFKLDKTSKVKSKKKKDEEEVEDENEEEDTEESSEEEDTDEEEDVEVEDDEDEEDDE